MTALLIPNNSEPLAGPNTGISVEFGDSWNSAVAKLNQASSQVGVNTVNFGAVPGASDTSTAITGQTNIVAGSSVDAWIICTATADHSADEHWVDPPIIYAGNIVPGTGFSIYAKSNNDAAGIDSPAYEQYALGAPSAPVLSYGLWSVAWQWL